MDRLKCCAMSARDDLSKLVLSLLLVSPVLTGAEVHIRLSFGNNLRTRESFHITVRPATPLSKVSQLHEISNYQGNALQETTWTGQAGDGQVASLTFTLTYPDGEPRDVPPLHIMWSDLISHSSPDAAERLSRDWADAANQGGVKILVGDDKLRGFVVTGAQIQRAQGMWIPAYSLFVTLENHPVSFDAYRHSSDEEKTTLERVAQEPEATYDTYASKWADMGNPSYVHPHQVAPGHVICLSWDSSLAKFGIDRGAGVWNDYGNEDHFRFWFGFGDLTQGIIKSWQSQRLQDGLPVVTTTFQEGELRYEVEQFAYPLNGPPKERRGDIPMVLLQKVRVTNLGAKRARVPISMTHSRLIPVQTGTGIECVPLEKGFLFRDRARQRGLLFIQETEGSPLWHQTLDYQNEDKRVARSARFDVVDIEEIEPSRSREIIVKLPSPSIGAESADVLAHLDYAEARQATLNFWLAWVARGAQFEVPEKTVNDLLRASVWHALRLPRRHGGDNPDVKIDLPYSNFAYDQTGIPWPGVHCIYVDYMIYELRGYSSVALEELLDAFRRNQDVNGHVSGFANWMMYTPAMLYASAQYYLLSQDHKGFEQLLPYAVRALDWCESECKRATTRPDFSGLVEGPLNDGTGTGIWAINQAYMYAGLERVGQALQQIGNARAQSVLAEAAQFRDAAEAGFTQATASAPVVRLRDGSWQPFVPSDARVPRRLMELWYPTDVDTGPLHLVRLKLLPAKGQLADFLLNDHEDNLFLKNWGMANEPVYKPQGLPYLYRDNAKAAVRTFYSQMACAFSHSVFEPVEHRWMHGQYFGPPSTDGSWFELLRNMLVREVDDKTLILGQATPRDWLEDSKDIDVSGAPTRFGPISFHIRSESRKGQISARVRLSSTDHLDKLLVRLRHPEEKAIRTVSVNGQDSKAFNADREWIEIEKPRAGTYEILANY
jgi:hypothetical protein